MAYEKLCRLRKLHLNIPLASPPFDKQKEGGVRSTLLLPRITGSPRHYKIWSYHQKSSRTNAKATHHFISICCTRYMQVRTLADLAYTCPMLRHRLILIAICNTFGYCGLRVTLNATNAVSNSLKTSTKSLNLQCPSLNSVHILNYLCLDIAKRRHNKKDSHISTLVDDASISSSRASSDSFTMMFEMIKESPE